MKKFLQNLTLIAAFALPWAIQAQTLDDNYLYTTGVDSSRWVAVPTSVTSLITPGAGDAGKSAVTNLGFTFSFGGTNYTQFSVNADGNLRLGATQTGTANYTTPFSTTNAAQNSPKINMFGCDGYCDANHYVRYIHTEINGDSVGVVEFCTGTYTTTTRSYLYKWQVHLYHNGKIECVFGPAPTAGPAVTRQMGMCLDASAGFTIDTNHFANFFTNGTSDVLPTGNWPAMGRYYVLEPYTATCPRPTNLHAANIGSGAVTLAWTEAGSATTWRAVLNSYDDSTNDGTETIVTDTTVQFTGLMANTQYTADVYSICGAGDTSVARPVAFRTSCLELSRNDMPYSYGFEDASATGSAATINPCWSKGTNYTTAYPYPSSTYTHSGTYALYFYTTATYYSYLVMPPVEDSVQDLQVTFHLYTTSTTSYYGQMDVGVMTDPNNISTFTQIGTTRRPSATSTWEEFVVDLNTYTGTGRYIAFRKPATGTGYTYLDDITLKQSPDCLRVDSVSVSDVQTTTATVTWAEQGDATSWVVEYGPTGFTRGNGTTMTVTAPTAQLTGLTPMTLYDVYIAPTCNGIPGYNSISFMTACAAISTLPYNYGFEDCTTGIRSVPNCWTFASDGSGTYANYYPYINTTNPHSGTKAIYAYMTSTSTATAGYPHYLVMALPPVDTTVFDITDLTLRFYARCNSTSYPTNLRVGVMSDPNDTSTFQTVQSYTSLTNTAHQEFVVDFVNFQGHGAYIALFMPSRTSTAQYLYIDDFTLELSPDCPRVEDIAVLRLTADSAVIAWRENGSATSWNIEYDTAGFARGTGTTVTVFDTIAVIDNLNPQTAYDVYITPDCDGMAGLNSTTFITACVPMDTLPYTQNFDGVAGSTATSAAVNNLPLCWKHYNEGTSTSYSGYPIVYNSASYSHSGSNSMRFYTYITAGTYADQIAILPAFDVDNYPWSNVEMSFWHRANSTSYVSTVVVGVMASPADPTTFVPMDTITSQVTTYEQHIVSFANYMGYNGYIAFKFPQPTTGYNYGYVDDIAVYSAECPVPTAVVTDISSNSVTLNWANVSASFEYILCDSEPTADSVPFTVSDTTLTLTDLSANTSYTLWLRTDCGSGYSAWTSTSFRTACGDIDSLPWTESFEGQPTGTSSSSVFATCWTRLNNGTSYFGYPYVSNTSSYAHSGGAGLYWYGSTTTGTYGDYQVIVAPAIDTTRYAMNNLMVKFWTKASSTSYHPVFKVGVMTNPDDVTTFVGMDTINVEGTDWTEFEIPLVSYTGHGRYIAIKADRPTSAWYAYVDDITIQPMPNCPHVADITIDSAYTGTAYVSWTELGSASQWHVEYGTHGFTRGNGTSLYVSNANAALTGLAGNTSYDVYVTALCDGNDSSSAELYTFTSPCAAIVIPFSEDFEGQTAGSSSSASFISCWSHMNNGTSYFGYPYVGSSSTYNHTTSGTNGLYWYATTTTGTYGDYEIIALPPLGDTTPANHLQLSFWAKASSASYTPVFKVGVMTSPSDPSTFVGVDTITVTTGTTWTLFEIPLAAYTGNGRYIAIKADRPSSTWTAYMDDILLDFLPACPKVSGITATSISQNGATIVWTESGSATQWEYQLDDDAPVVVTTTSATLTNLATSTAYTIRVRALCGGGDTSNWESYTFRTVCGSIALPYTQDFEDEATTTSTSTTFAACWAHLNNGTSYFGYPYISSSTTYNHTTGGTKGLYWYASTTTGTYGDYEIIALPPIDDSTDASGLQLNFWTRATSASYVPIFKVGVMTNPTDPTSFVGVDTITVTTGTTWTEVEVPLAAYNGNGKYVAIKSDRPATAWYANVDDITLDYLPSCPKVSGLSASAIGQNSATIVWTESGSATQWEYQLDDDTPVVVNATSVSLTNLAASTAYTISVRAICGAGDTSNWASYLFRTVCGTISMPYTQDFETETTGSTTSTSFAACWTRLNNGTTYFGYPYVAGSATYNHTYNGNKGLYWYGSTTATTYGDYQIVSLPPVDDSTDVNTLQLSLWTRSSSASYNPVFKIGVMTDPNTPSTFVGLDTLTLNGSIVWTEYEFPLSAYTGNGKYVAIKADRPTSSWYAYVDDITLDYIPTCPRVRNVVSTGATQTSVTIDWTDMTTSASNWLITYTADGITNSTTVSSHPATITGLTASSQYIVRVYPMCSVSDTGRSSDPITVATECDVIAAPYFEDFNVTTATTYNEAGGLPPCWDAISNGTNSVYTPHVVGSSSYWYSRTGNSLIMTSGSETYGSTKYVRLPEFQQPVNTLTMSFWLSTENSSYGTLAVGYCTSDTIDDSFVAIREIPASANTYHGSNTGASADGMFDTVSFANAPANARYLAFRWIHTSSFYSVCLDDIEVTSTIAGCTKPVLGAPAVTYSTADLTWNGSGDNYQVSYRPAAAASWSEPADVSAHTYTLTNLSPATAYEYRVRQDCDSNAYSDWTVGTFVTDSMPCFAPTALQATNVQGTSAQFSWTPGSSETQWNLNVFNATFQLTVPCNATNATVNDLTPGVQYFAAVSAFCGNGDVESDYSDTITFTTDVCDPVTNLSATVNGTSATLTWTAGANNNGQWEIEYGLRGFSQGEGTMVQVTNTTATLNNLYDETEYQAYVRAVCGSNYVSTWSNVVDFTTEHIGISHVEGQMNVSIYPNPATGATTISLSGVDGIVNIAIVDMNGRTVLSDAMECQGDCVKKLDVNNLAQGAYFVRIYSDSVNTVKKLIVR